MVVFFHGNEATLTRDVRNRQAVPRQVTGSGLNAVLVAPQFAVNALDPSAGRFWEPGVFAQFLREAGERLTELYGDARARGAFHAAPVVVAAYSGGYNPAAFILHSGRADDRLRGVVLFDALYGEYDKFAGWLEKRPPAFFLSTFGKASREENATLQRLLTERGVRFQNVLPANLARGSVAFVAATDDVKHIDFMTEAWVSDPLKAVLRRIPGFTRPTVAPAGAAPRTELARRGRPSLLPKKYGILASTRAPRPTRRRGSPFRWTKMTPSPDAVSRAPILVDFALQGGGAHGAFTWGVLDRLLEEPWLRHRRHLRHLGRRDERRGAGRRLMPTVAPRRARRAGEFLAPRLPGGAASARSGAVRSTCCWAAGRSTIRRMFVAMDLMARVFSPYDLNPSGANPLRDILAEVIDFERLTRAPIKLFVTATNVRTGRGRVFRNGEITPDVLLASACLPTHVPGHRDRRRELLGRRLFRQSRPSRRWCANARRSDTILVQINPVERPGTPRSARDILNRLNEVSFNAVLLKELRDDRACCGRSLTPADCESAKWADMRIHRVSSDDHGRARLFVEAQRRVGIPRPCCATRAARRASIPDRPRTRIWAGARASISTNCWKASDTMGLIGILLGLALLIWLALRGWSVLLLAPAAALLAAAFARRAAAGRAGPKPSCPARRPSWRNSSRCSCSAPCSASSWTTAARSRRSPAS